MISRGSVGWQTTMADLALILFMVTAAGVQAHKNGRDQPAEEAPSAAPAQGEALAVYRAGDDAPPLGQWLTEQAPDRRQHLTIVARYRAGNASAAAAEALALATEAGEAGVSARIVLEPGPREDRLATLAFDRPATVAQPLQSSSQD